MYIDAFFPLTIGIGGINDGFLFNCFSFRMDGLTGLIASTSTSDGFGPIWMGLDEFGCGM